MENLDDLEMLDVRKGDEDSSKESLLSEKPNEIIPEVEYYLSLLVLVFLIDQRKFDLVRPVFRCLS